MSLRGAARRYRVAIIAAAAFLVLVLSFPSLAPKAGRSFVDQVKTMLLILPPIFLLLGLLDVWVPRKTLMKYMGPRSGLKGPLVSFALGSVAAGPLYAAFPVSAILMRKGASFTNILIFIGAWSTTKIPMFLLETHALGTRFAVSRLLIDVPGIVLIALALKAIIPTHEVARLYAAAESTGTPEE